MNHTPHFQLSLLTGKITLIENGSEKHFNDSKEAHQQAELLGCKVRFASRLSDRKIFRTLVK